MTTEQAAAEKAADEMTEAAYYARTANPAQPTATPKDIRKVMAKACGEQAGVYVETFWRARGEAAKNAAPWPKVTDSALSRHEQKFAPTGVTAAVKRQHAEAVADVRRQYGSPKEIDAATRS